MKSPDVSVVIPNRISFVIPCYNTTDAIHSVMDEISESMKEYPEYTYEIILVNDASPDGETLSRLKKAVDERDEDITLVDLVKNCGQHSAILAGFRYATGDLVMTSDDDNQTSLNCIGKFIESIRMGRDVVFGKYSSRPKEQKRLMRRFGSFMSRKLSAWLIERPSGITASNIFMARRFVIEEMIQYDQPFPYISGLVLRITHNVANVELEQRERMLGDSGYTFRKLLSLWLNGFTAFSVKPLRVADAIGILVAVIGFIMAIVTIIRKFMFPGIQAGWSSLLSVMLILAGINFVVLGVVGEYIGKMYMCINKTPQSVVRTVYKNKS